MSDNVWDLVILIGREAQTLAASGDVDALRITLRHIKRFVAGHAVYGSLDIDKDPRSMLSEMRSEMDDALFYLEAQMIKEERRCDQLNARAAQSRTSYRVQADASLSVPEPATQES